MKKIFFPEVKINYKSSANNIAVLDGIRGFAITLVIGFHFFGFSFGWSGVDLFFVLSGFLIGGKLLDAKEKNNYYAHFWMRRVLRIFPLYYLALIMVFLPKLLYNINTIEDPSWTYWLYLQNWEFTFDGSFPKGNGTLNHFWSLAVEEQFYFIVPFIIRYCEPSKLISVLLFFIAGSLVARIFFWSQANIGYYVFTLSRLDVLCMGVLAAYYIRYKKEYVQKMVFPFFYFSLFIITAVIVISNSSYENDYFVTGGFTAIGVLYSSLIMLCIAQFKYNIIQAFFCTRIFIFLGKISYGLYVFHWIFYSLLLPPVQRKIDVLLLHPSLSKTIASIIMAGITILVSYFSYALFEKRFLNLKKKFS